ncbi:MAG: lycopene cyclase family protein, partial [Oscillospiraceae bacterium]|nr:lycopene cyclase family protein [Oscillospiraceae bacterium]
MNIYDVVIIGAGPAGIFTALELTSLEPGLKILMVDSGRSIKKRVCPARSNKRCTGCKPCSIMRGWGGAGAFSDGKLSLSDEVGGNIVDYLGKAPARELINYADSTYVRFGAPDTVHGLDDRRIEEIIYEASKNNIRFVPCPVRHMGTETAFEVLNRMFEHLCQQPGFEFRELTEAVRIIVENGKVKSVVIAPAIAAAAKATAAQQETASEPTAGETAGATASEPTAVETAGATA